MNINTNELCKTAENILGFHSCLICSHIPTTFQYMEELYFNIVSLSNYVHLRAHVRFLMPWQVLRGMKVMFICNTVVTYPQLFSYSVP